MTGETVGVLLTLGLLVGLDNLQVGAGLGLVEMSTRRRWALAGSFALAETLMPLLGLLVGRSAATLAGEWGDGIGIVMLALAGALILGSAWRNNEADVARCDSSTLNVARFALPISLAFDNLLAGAGLGALGYPVLASALAIGAVSGALAALGLFAGSWLRPFVPKRAEMLGGGFLLLLATIRLIRMGV